MTGEGFEDRIDAIADRILNRCNEATKAKDSGDPGKAGELFGEVADLAGRAIRLLEAVDAAESRVEKWKTFQEEARRESESLLENGESDVDVKSVFDIPELSPNLAVTVRNTEDTPERKTVEAVQKPSGEVALNDEPSWAPTVSVVGLGPTGEETVGMIETGTSARVHVSPRPESVADSDFLFLTADLGEPGVTEQALEILEATGEDACTVLFGEGPTDDPEGFVDDINLFFPVAVTEGDGRQFLSSAIADLFECMLRPTIHELGKGDILKVAGERRLGKVFIDDLEDTSQLGDLTPDIRADSIDAMLVLACYDGPRLHPDVERKTREYDRPDDADFLRDPRTHSRYEGRAHIKRITAVEVDRGEMIDLLEA